MRHPGIAHGPLELLGADQAARIIESGLDGRRLFARKKKFVKSRVLLLVGAPDDQAKARIVTGVGMRERRASHRIIARAVERHRQARNCEFIAEGALRLNQQRMGYAAMMTRIVKETEHGVGGIARTDDRLLAQVELEHPAVNLKAMIDHIATQ